MYRFLSPMSCFLYGVLTSSVLPSYISDNKSLYRYAANVFSGFSRTHRGISDAPFCVVRCISRTQMPLSLPHKPKSPHLVSPRYHLSSALKNRNLTRLDALKSIWVFSALSLLLFRFQNHTPLYSETRATPHSPRFRKAFYASVLRATLLTLPSHLRQAYP